MTMTWPWHDHDMDMAPWICWPYRVVARSKGGDSSARAGTGAARAASPATALRRPAKQCPDLDSEAAPEIHRTKMAQQSADSAGRRCAICAICAEFCAEFYADLSKLDIETDKRPCNCRFSWLVGWCRHTFLNPLRYPHYNSSETRFKIAQNSTVVSSQTRYSMPPFLFLISAQLVQKMKGSPKTSDDIWYAYHNWATAAVPENGRYERAVGKTAWPEAIETAERTKQPFWRQSPDCLIVMLKAAEWFPQFDKDLIFWIGIWGIAFLWNSTRCEHLALLESSERCPLSYAEMSPRMMNTYRCVIHWDLTPLHLVRLVRYIIHPSLLTKFLWAFRYIPIHLNDPLVS